MEPQINRYKRIIKPTVYRAPGFDPVGMFEELIAKVQGNGGHIEQTLSYIDSCSAYEWMKIAQQHAYQSYGAETSIPYSSIAESVYDSLLDTPEWDGKSLEVILLGAGDAQKEIRLVRALLDGIPKLENLSVCLVDVSQPLLSMAERNVTKAFPKESNVDIYSVEGNFLHFQRYKDLFQDPPGTRLVRFVVLLGFTFGNLDSEIEFIRNSLGGFKKGDMFLTDFGFVEAPASDLEGIKRKDPYVQPKNPLWKKTVGAFITCPFRKHRVNHEYVEFRPIVDNTLCVIEGSYCIELRVVVVGKDGSEHVFLPHRVKRHDAEKLVHAVCDRGWEARKGWTYDYQQKCGLYLWKRE